MDDSLTPERLELLERIYSVAKECVCGLGYKNCTKKVWCDPVRRLLCEIISEGEE